MDKKHNKVFIISFILLLMSEVVLYIKLSYLDVSVGAYISDSILMIFIMLILGLFCWLEIIRDFKFVDKSKPRENTKKK